MTPQKKSRFNPTFASISVAFIAASVFLVLPSFKKENGQHNDTLNEELINGYTSTVTTEALQDDVVQVEAAPVQAEMIEVTGTRATIQSSIDQKRISTEIVDGLSADEIGDIPALSVGEALETITAASSHAKTQATPTKVKINRSVSLSAAPHIGQEPVINQQTRLDSHEEHPEYETSPIKLVSEEPVSTFSIDVDTASYSLTRNQLNNGYLPNPQAVRAEEFINYFNYDYPSPKSKQRPFESTLSVLNSPWNEGRKLVHIGIKLSLIHI